MALRQEIEKILCGDCKKDSAVVVAFDCPKCRVRKQLDRICTAIGKTAEGMPKPKNYYDTHDYYAHGESATHIARLAAQDGINGTHSTCQAYWKKGLGK